MNTATTTCQPLARLSCPQHDFIKPADGSHKAQLKPIRLCDENPRGCRRDSDAARESADKIEAFNGSVQGGHQYLVSRQENSSSAGRTVTRRLTGRKIVDLRRQGRTWAARLLRQGLRTDRSAAYANVTCQEHGGCRCQRRMLVQLAYAIGVAEPVSVMKNTYGRSHRKGYKQRDYPDR